MHRLEQGSNHRYGHKDWEKVNVQVIPGRSETCEIIQKQHLVVALARSYGTPEQGRFAQDTELDQMHIFDKARHDINVCQML